MKNKKGCGKYREKLVTWQKCVDDNLCESCQMDDLTRLGVRAGELMTGNLVSPESCQSAQMESDLKNPRTGQSGGSNPPLGVQDTIFKRIRELKTETSWSERSDGKLSGMKEMLDEIEKSANVHLDLYGLNYRFREELNKIREALG